MTNLWKWAKSSEGTVAIFRYLLIALLVWTPLGGWEMLQSNAAVLAGAICVAIMLVLVVFQPKEFPVSHAKFVAALVIAPVLATAVVYILSIQLFPAILLVGVVLGIVGWILSH